jgi:hypothetical protein
LDAAWTSEEVHSKSLQRIQEARRKPGFLFASPHRFLAAKPTPWHAYLRSRACAAGVSAYGSKVERQAD